MRHIHLDDGLKLRFPGRSEEFDQGVEIGMVAALMQSQVREFSRWISAHNLDQVRALAERLGYRLVEGSSDSEWSQVTFRFGHARPQFRLVHSAG